MVIVPVLDPLDVGANVTLMVQFAPAATPVPQVLLWENSLLFVLVNETLMLPNIVDTRTCVYASNVSRLNYGGLSEVAQDA